MWSAQAPLQESSVAVSTCSVDAGKECRPGKFLSGCPRCQYNTDVVVLLQNHNHNIW